jgi:hypothetical protein
MIELTKKRIKTTLVIMLWCGMVVSGFSQTSYWQQKVDVSIDVRLDDSLHFLHGDEKIVYANNSPDELTYIYFHLYPNAYKNVRTAFANQMVENGSVKFLYSDKYQRGYIDSLDFKVLYDEGQMSAKVEATKDVDIVKLILPKPLQSGGKITITTPFRVKIPHVFSRLGHVKQSYQITQWFPKPAVYDAGGWHQMPYLDQGEFYSEYGDYEVRINLPSNYVVMGTGNVMEESENQWMLEKSKENILVDQVEGKTPKSSKTRKTITFKESNIHEFAWFADKRWALRIDTLEQPNHSGKVIAFSAYYPWHNLGWSTSLDAVKKTIEGYGSKVGIYPYNTVKVVEGFLEAGGGMEYPTVTVIQESNTPSTVERVIIHEVGHNWFYGILGSNERKHPWMDEGINSFYEGKFATSIKLPFIGNTQVENLAYYTLGAAYKLSPATLSSEEFHKVNYGIDVYMKVPLYLRYLEAYMGEASFDKAMQAYFQKWRFKHPQPKDFKQVFKENAPTDIDWFFTMLQSDEMVSFTVSKPEVKGVETHIQVTNNCSFALPVAINGVDKEGKVVNKWTEPFLGTKQITLNNMSSAEPLLLDSSIPNGNVKYSSSERKVALKPIAGINTGLKKTAWIAPSIGYNAYDGFMAGILLHNVTLPQNRFRYIVNPMYGFRRKGISGSAILNFSQQLNGKTLDYIDYFMYFKRYGYQRTFLEEFPRQYMGYTKLSPEVVFHFKKPSLRSPIKSTLSVKGYFISEQQLIYDTMPEVDPHYGENINNIYGKVNYTYASSRAINPFNYELEGQMGSTFAKLSVEGYWKFNYSIPKKGFHVRAYAGKFFKFSNNFTDTYRYRLANSFSGSNDYLYDYTYIGRNEPDGLWSRQTSMREGGFKFNTPLYSNQPGFNDDYLISLNLKTDVPVKWLPLRLCFDVSKYGGRRLEGASNLLFVAGAEIFIFDYLKIYIPLIMSKEYQDYKKFILGDSFLKSITFSHNLNSINWVRLPDTFIGIE